MLRMGDSGSAARYSDLVVTEIRAELGRRRITGRELSTRLGKPQAWASRRLTGTVVLTVDDLSRIAAAIDIPVHSLLPQDSPRVG